MLPSIEGLVRQNVSRVQWLEMWVGAGTFLCVQISLVETVITEFGLFPTIMCVYIAVTSGTYRHIAGICLKINV